MENDDKLIRAFLQERKQKIKDDGFTNRTLRHLPNVEYVPLTHRKWFMVLMAVLAATLLVVLYLHYAKSLVEGISLSCLPLVAKEYLFVVGKNILRLISSVNLPVLVGLILSVHFFIGREIYLRLKD